MQNGIIMESSALLANVALIVSKDLLNDEKTAEPVEPFYQIMFDEDEDADEAEYFFLYQQQKRAKCDSAKPIKTVFLNFLNQFDSQTFESFLHLSKPTFMRLFESVRDLLSKPHLPNNITQQTTFSLSLWKMCRDEHFEEIARRFDVPFFDCQTSIRQFWKVISNNESRFIKWPSKNDLNVRSSGPIGVIALKRLDIFLESNDQEVQVIWQIVCNSERKILDCYVESLHDYDFDLSPIAKMLQKQSPSQRQIYLIGDENFPLRTYLINPFPSPNSDEELKFNNECKKYFYYAQNTFDILAKQFNTLYALESKDLFEVRRIISCICCLHNLCVDINDDYGKRQEDTVKSVNWSKPVHMENRKHSENQEALRRRNDLLKEIINPEMVSDGVS